MAASSNKEAAILCDYNNRRRIIVTLTIRRAARALPRPVILRTAPGAARHRRAPGTIERYQPDVDLVAVTNPGRFHCHTKVAKRFHAGRVLLGGDAAHVCSLAQGTG